MSVDLDRQLREYCRFMDEAQGSLSLDDILERSGELPVIPGRGVVPLHRTKRKWLVAAAAALAVLIVAVVLRFLPVRETSPGPVVNQTTTTTLPTTSAALVTPLGTFDWWHLSGIEDEIPGLSWAVKVDSGYLMIETLGHLESGGTRFWRSPDGRTWSLGETPAMQGNTYAYEFIGGEHWLLTDAFQVWRSQDGESWVQVDLPAGFSDGPRNTVQLREMDGQPLLVDWISPGMWRFSPSASAWELVTVLLAPGGSGSGTFALTGNPATVGDTTVILTTFDSESPTMEIELTVIGPDGEASSVPAPWAALAAPPEAMDQAAAARGVTVLATGDRFLAFVVDTTIEIWSSFDGVTWTGPTTPEFLGGQIDAAYGSFQEIEGVLIAEVFDSSNTARVWTSEDGVEWLDSGIPPQNFSQLIPFSSGGFYLGDQPMQELFVSADLRNWERVDATGPAIWDADSWLSGRATISATEDAIFFNSFSMNTHETDIWVLQLQQ